MKDAREDLVRCSGVKSPVLSQVRPTRVQPASRVRGVDRAHCTAVLIGVASDRRHRVDQVVAVFTPSSVVARESPVR